MGWSHPLPAHLAVTSVTLSLLTPTCCKGDHLRKYLFSSTSSGIGGTLTHTQMEGSDRVVPLVTPHMSSDSCK
jgi:hypothetical protein